MRHVLIPLLLALAALHLAPVQGRRLHAAAAAAGPPPPPQPARLAVLPASALEGDAADTPEQQAPPGTVEMKIIDGEPAVPDQWGFMVALLENGRFFCGGTMLDASSVLTAAHCVVDTKLVDTPSALSIWRIDGTTYPVAKIFAHPGYSASTIPNDNADGSFSGRLHDLAVLKLSAPVLGPVSVTLANATTPVLHGQLLEVAGWGTTETGQASTVLKTGNVSYLTPGQCPPDYDDVLCAGGTGENTCNGDSGGPLVKRDAVTGVAVQVGITSHGPDCLSGSATFAYGYYTDVREYRDVIAAFVNGTTIPWPPASPSAGGSSGAPAGSGRPAGSGTPVSSGTKPIVVSTPAGSDPLGGVGFISGNDPNGQLGWGSQQLNQILCQIFGC